VWRDGEAEKAEKSGEDKTSEGTAGGTSKAAPTPVRPLAELEPERLANLCAAALRRPTSGK
ncbi:MAG: hypothetical protein IJY15_00750, partial [Thermoguttaceae bacterium]|nr:hypothetical protein [Thermoguttaceae bacterium]